MTTAMPDLDRQDPEPADHPDDQVTQAFRRESEPGARPAAGRVREWVQEAPAERAPLLVIPGIWAGAEFAHLAHLPALVAGAATVAAAGIAFGLGERRQPRQDDGIPGRDPEPGLDEDDAGAGGDGDDAAGHAAIPGAYRNPHPRLRGIELAAAVFGTGTWVTLADRLGAFGGPEHLMAWLYLGGSAGGYWWLRTHEAVRAARTRREAEALAAEEAARRAEEQAAKRRLWEYDLARETGLSGSHLMRIRGRDQGILNGEEWEIDLHGARKLADDVDTRRVGKILAGHTRQAKQMVEVRPDPDEPYRLYILWRDRDTWAGGKADGILWHPWKSGSFDPEAPFADLVPPSGRSIRRPLAVGADPETGRPLLLPLWDEEGAKRIAVIATSGKGKSSAFDTLKEGVSACPDARIVQINLSKAVEEGWWEPLAVATARTMSSEAAVRAQAILDFATASFGLRCDAPRRQAGAREHVPTPAEPLFVLFIDEVDKLVEDERCKQLLDEISGKCRSEGWALVLGAQRPIKGWISTAIRANLTHWLVGIMRPNDLRSLAGDGGLWLPDMNLYARGMAGVFGLLPNPTFEGMEFSRGRVFFWGKTDGSVRLPMLDMIAARAASQPRYQLEPVLAPLAGQWSVITGAEPASKLTQSDPRYDVVKTPGGQTVPGVAQARARMAQAQETLLAPPARQQDQAGRDTLDAQAQEKLRELLFQPGGTTLRPAADAVGVSRATVHKQFQAWQARGLIELRGAGPGQHWEPTGKPWLRVVPGHADPADQTAVSGALPAEDEAPAGAGVPAEAPGRELTPREAVLAAAIWALAYGSPETGVDLEAAAQHLRADCGLPEDAVAAATELLRTSLPVVVRHAVRTVSAGGAGPPSWLARWLPAVNDSEDQGAGEPAGSVSHDHLQGR
jgi:hypothetical protein